MTYDYDDALKFDNPADRDTRVADFCIAVADELDRRIAIQNGKFIRCQCDALADSINDTDLLELRCLGLTVRTSGATIDDHVDDFLAEVSGFFESARELQWEKK